jgi:phosphatidate cytidylyltransferase
MDNDRISVHTPAEGVRIIGADAADRTQKNEQVKVDLNDLDSDLESTPPGMQHWTEPPTGEVLQVLSEIDAPSGTDELSDGPIWRDEHTGWEDAPVAEQLSDQPPVTISSRSSVPQHQGARSSTSHHHDDDRLPAEVIMNTRIVTGAALALVAAVAFLLGPAALVVVATLAGALGAFELYTSMRHVGLKPAIPVGILSVVCLSYAAYARGDQAIGVVLVLSVFATLLWFLVGASPGRPTVSSAATFMGVLYPGLSIGFASLTLRVPNHEGLALVFGAVFVTCLYDTFAFMIGRQFGRRPLAANISPGKTVEGAIGGTIAAVVGAVLIVSMMHPWNFGSALLLGIIVSVVAPFGDVCESMIKRDLETKDMGHFLPGHGGVLDRIDSLVFVVPAVYFMAIVINII